MMTENASGNQGFDYGYVDRRIARAMREYCGEKTKKAAPPVVTKECAICTELVDREALFNGVCKECQGETKEAAHDPR